MTERSAAMRDVQGAKVSRPRTPLHQASGPNERRTSRGPMKQRSTQKRGRRHAERRIALADASEETQAKSLRTLSGGPQPKPNPPDTSPPSPPPPDEPDINPPAEPIRREPALRWRTI
jgi:hypothetical protein